MNNSLKQNVSRDFLLNVMKVIQEIISEIEIIRK